MKSWLIGKDPGAGRDWGQEEKGTIEDEMAGWHHWLDAHEFGWTPGVDDGQGGLACCDSWGRKELEMTEWLNWTETPWISWIIHGNEEIQEGGDTGFIANKADRSDVTVFVSLVCIAVLSGKTKAWSHAHRVIVKKWWHQDSDSSLLIVPSFPFAWFSQSAQMKELSVMSCCHAYVRCT